MKIVLVCMLVAIGASAAELKLGDWHVIGPFKDEEFGNMDRSLAYVFAPEMDVFHALELPAGVKPAENLALKAKASSPDDMPEQGHAVSGANDGDPETYRDDKDGGREYVLRLDWKEPVSFRAVVLSGWKHDDYAPRTFQLIADGHVVCEVADARYTENSLTVIFDTVQASRLAGLCRPVRSGLRESARSHRGWQGAALQGSAHRYDGQGGVHESAARMQRSEPARRLGALVDLPCGAGREGLRSSPCYGD
ncbi:hypothetical protein PDESU_03030 [Pontiella desulfatans]|uniref:Uncharacterized protein n=1 Tax=Pontiella desulfatans TaxID=2750659 RepID=A0A6C2U381_PONDE|nr:hypothetical protein [Pontiella desulfatans]VGO14468.1 hypothetical protein PDESU_03030 [Pontiella desulfatans]